MTNKERQNWIINIESTSTVVESYLGSAVVQSILERFGAHSIEDLNPINLPEVFNELYAIEADLG